MSLAHLPRDAQVVLAIAVLPLGILALLALLSLAQ